MKSSITTLEDNKVKVSVDIDEAEIDQAIGEAFKKIATEVHLPGFRKGKAPRKVLEARIGKEYARGEALNEAIPEHYRQAIIDHDVDVISPPDLEIVSGEEGGAVTFEAVVEVRPEVSVAGYNGLRIEIPAPVASDEEIEAQVESLRNQFAEREEVDRPTEDGDYVTIDISGSQDGEPVEGLTAEDYTYEVGSGFVVEEMDDNIRGVNVGDVIDFEGAHPQEEDTMLAFNIVVKKVEAKVLPELTDEFVAESTEFATVDELMADTRTRIENQKKSQSEMVIADKTGEALSELVTIDVPEALIEDQVQRQLQDMAMRLAQQGIQFEQFLQMTGQDISAMAENMKEPAEQAAKVDLALRAVVVAEGMEVTDDELQQEIDDTAAQIGQDGAALKAQLVENGQLSGLRTDIAKQRAMEMLLESVEIVDEDGNPIDRADLEVPVEEPAAEIDAAADAADGNIDDSDDVADQTEETESSEDADDQGADE